MLVLLQREIRSFLSSLIGYIVIGVFLLIISLFLWVFDGTSNIFQVGLASLEALFYIAPWVFMLLIPAITMRSFSEEKRTGTLELLLTRPVSDFKIVGAKYLAGVVLVVIALLPTLVYYISVYVLGQPVGNLDSGGTWGSYIGLLLLAAGFVSIGIFASSITSNQIVAFLISLFLCFFTYTGFESIASFASFGSFDRVLINLGMNEHYRSLSRGVVDTRDVAYFLVLIGIFLTLTHLSLKSRKW